MRKQFGVGDLPLACVKHCIMSERALNPKSVMHKNTKKAERVLDNFSKYTAQKIETLQLSSNLQPNLNTSSPLTNSNSYLQQYFPALSHHEYVSPEFSIATPHVQGGESSLNAQFSNYFSHTVPNGGDSTLYQQQPQQLQQQQQPPRQDPW